MRPHFTPASRDKSESGHRRFVRPSAPSPVPSGVPLFRRDAGACACGGGCPRCGASAGQPLAAALRSRFEGVQHADFSGVRVHPEAPEITAPLHARAVTLGQDIYFHPGEFDAGTPKGEALLAHELAHTRQTRASMHDGSADEARVSRPGDALERNADALARGETTRALAAPGGVALRSPFDSESADDRTRRQALIQSINNAIDRLIRVLQSGALIQPAETATERNGVRGVLYGAQAAASDQEFISYTDRDARIRRIIRSLMAMGTLYRTAPIPADFSAPVQQESGEYNSTVRVPGGTSNYGGSTAEWADLQAAYERYRLTQGQTGDAYESDWYYLDPTNRIVPGAARGAPRMARGIQTGAYMVVPDIDREPLRYWRLTGSSPVPRGSTIVEFWHDDLGYYYQHNGQRIDVPNPWTM